MAAESDLPLIGDPERWLMMHFGIPGLWVTLRDPEAAASELAAGLRVWLDDRELLLEVLEVWHREVVTRQYCDEDGWFDGTSRADGQTRLRELINPVLAKLDPPLEMRSIGQIVGTEALGLTGLTDHPLPDTKAGDAVRGRVMDAVARFRDREATAEDRRSALEQLASVLREAARQQERENRGRNGRMKMHSARSRTTTGFDITTPTRTPTTAPLTANGSSTPSLPPSA